MLNVQRDHIPNMEQINFILNRISEDKKLPEWCLSEEEYLIAQASLAIQKDKVEKLITRLGLPSGSDEKMELALNKNGLEELDITIDYNNSFTVIPIGLFIRALFSKGSLNEKTTNWLEKVKNLYNSKFAILKYGANPTGMADSFRYRYDSIWEERNRLRKELREAKTALENYENRFDQMNLDLLRKKDRLQRKKARLDQLQPIASKYEVRNADPKYIGGDFLDDNSIHAQHYNGISNMTTLIETGIEHTCRDLENISDGYTFEEIKEDSPDIRPYHFNRSEEIAIGEKFESHRCAIVTFFIFRLLEGSGLKKDDGDCHGDLKVFFNDQDLCIESSHPLCVPLDPEQPPRTLFQNPSSWALKPDPNYYPEGIHPVEAKIILSRLSDHEKIVLKRLILDPFMLLDDQLREAYAYRDQNTERGNLVRVGYDLIYTLATALKHNFEVAIGRKLLEVLNDDAKEPFSRPEQITFHPLTDEEEIDWAPNWKCIPNEIQDTVKKRQQQLSIIWKNISEDLLNKLENPDLTQNDTLGRRNYRQQLKKQFYIKHNFRHSSCRMDTLATLLFQENPTNFDQTWSIMKAIASYLNTPEGQKLFEAKLPHRNFALENIQESYIRQGKSILDDDLELELAAHALGITIGLFVPGAPVTYHKSGLIEPSIFFGPMPRTKGKFYILTDGGLSFYALEPKLVAPPEGNKPLIDAINDHLPYWRDAKDDEQVIMEEQGLI